MASLTFHDKKESYTIQVSQEQGKWLVEFLEKIAVGQTDNNFCTGKQTMKCRTGRF